MTLADLLAAAQGLPVQPATTPSALANLLGPYTGQGPDFLMDLLEAASARRAPAAPTVRVVGGQQQTQGQVYDPGQTDYRYRAWDKPFPGLQPDDPLLLSRRGVTLQRGPLRSLVEIARQSDELPGVRELRMIGQGYRSPAQQASAARTNPNAAPFGYSYHPMGLAIDAGWWTQHLAPELAAAGWRQLAGEPWHWSYGVYG